MCIRLINLPKAAFDDLFQYDSEGNLVEDKSKDLKISYDWRGMPVEFVRQDENCKTSVCDSTKLVLRYDGSGRRISKTRYSKNVQYGYWTRNVVTHYTGIGTEVRETMRRSASPKTTVVVNMPQGLGRYGADDVVNSRGNGRSFELSHNPSSFQFLALQGPCALGASLLFDIVDTIFKMLYLRCHGR